MQQTAANEEQIRDIEERIQSLADVLASPMGDQDDAENARRRALRKFVFFHNEMSTYCLIVSIIPRKLAGIIAKLSPLSEQHKLLKFLNNIDHANTLNGFIQDLGHAVTDYQVCAASSSGRSSSWLVQTSIQQNIYENTKKIDENTKKVNENTRSIVVRRLFKAGLGMN